MGCIQCFYTLGCMLKDKRLVNTSEEDITDILFFNSGRMPTASSGRKRC